MDPHQKALIAAAGRLGVSVRDLSEAWGEDLVAYEHSGRRELVYRGRGYASMSCIAERVCLNKAATVDLLAEMGIPTPKSRVFREPEAERQKLERFMKDGSLFVVKPLHGQDGVGVGMDLRSFDDVLAHWRLHRELDSRFLVEEQVPGEDLRIQAVGGHIAAACRREPASVVGDGNSTVLELAEARDRFVQGQNPKNRLELDEVSHELLREQELDLDAVPATGRKVRLKKIVNVGQGGHVIDVTDELHPLYREWVSLIARQVGIRIFSLDVISEDPGADPRRASRVLELNGKAQWLHHTFSEGRTHDIPALVLRDLLSLT